LFFLINRLEDFLRSDVVIPETGRRGLRLQFGYLLFFLVKVKETPASCRDVRLLPLLVLSILRTLLSF
jgi:hypothetical protein